MYPFYHTFPPLALDVILKIHNNFQTSTQFKKVSI